MEYKPKWLSAKDLMTRWGTKQARSILSAVKDGLLCYEEIFIELEKPDHRLKSSHEMVQQRIEPNDFELRYKVNGYELFRDAMFRCEDLEEFEAEHSETFDNIDFDNSKHAEFMRLKKANKWLTLITEAAPYMAYYVADRFEKGKKTTQKEFIKVGREKFPDLSKETFKTTLWKTVPKRYKNA